MSISDITIDVSLVLLYSEFYPEFYPDSAVVVLYMLSCRLYLEVDPIYIISVQNNRGPN